MQLIDLNEVWRLRLMIQNEERRLEKLRAAMEHITPAYDDMPRTKLNGSRIEHLTVKIIAAEHSLAELQSRAVLVAEQLKQSIANLPLTDLERMILQLLYAECMAFRDISRTLQISPLQVYNLHRQALDKVKNRLQ